MALDERARKSLFDALEQTIGRREATTLMELLPPVGWADVATKRDLEHLEIRIDAKLDRLRGELERGFRRTVQWNVGTVIAMSAIVLAITRGA